MIRTLRFVLITMLATATAAAAACVPGQVELRGDWGTARFSVEVADTDQERGQGLMFREKMARSAGMLFVYQKPEHAYFWMRNTLIPLDMLFLDKTGTVTRIHSNAVPLDETPIDGGEGVEFVLEINGGLAEKLGIDVGSELRSPQIGPDAAWPCD